MEDKSLTMVETANSTAQRAAPPLLTPLGRACDPAHIAAVFINVLKSLIFGVRDSVKNCNFQCLGHDPGSIALNRHRCARVPVVENGPYQPGAGRLARERSELTIHVKRPDPVRVLFADGFAGTSNAAGPLLPGTGGAIGKKHPGADLVSGSHISISAAKTADRPPRALSGTKRAPLQSKT